MNPFVEIRGCSLTCACLGVGRPLAVRLTRDRRLTPRRRVIEVVASVTNVRCAAESGCGSCAIAWLCVGLGRYSKAFDDYNVKNPANTIMHMMRMHTQLTTLSQLSIEKFSIVIVCVAIPCTTGWCKSFHVTSTILTSSISINCAHVCVCVCVCVFLSRHG